MEVGVIQSPDPAPTCPTDGPGAREQGDYPAPHISMLPYALVMSAMSVGLLVLIRMFTAGGLTLSVFLLGGFGVVGLGLTGCVYIAVKNWRAAQGLQQWQMQLATQREWSWGSSSADGSAGASLKSR